MTRIFMMGFFLAGELQEPDKAHFKGPRTEVTIKIVGLLLK